MDSTKIQTGENRKDTLKNAVVTRYEVAKADTSFRDTTLQEKKKKLHDPQNQMQFMQSDLESKKYNFYKRKEISTPLMPRYDTDSAAFQRGKKRGKQQQSYRNSQYYFPAKPKDAWEIGVNFGAAFVSGNVSPKLSPFSPFDNIGAGFTIRKAVGYVFSVRLQYLFQRSTGRNWRPDATLRFNRVLNPLQQGPGTNNTVRDSIGPSYYNNPKLDATRTSRGIRMNGFFFFNYRTYVHDVSLQAIVNIGNINFHRERNIINIYLLGGVDGYFYRTRYDALDENGQAYDFSPVMELQQTPANSPWVNASRKDRRKEAYIRLNQILDGKYETDAEQDDNLVGIKKWHFVPAFTVGAGIMFHATKWFTIGLEERVILSQSSRLLDGYRWEQDEHSSLTSHYDNISYTSLNFNFHIGLKKRTEPLYWLNPIQYSYKKIGDMNPEAIAEALFKDDDGDGVPNMLDKEPNTKKDCPVDTHGVALDSDKDGIIDCEDKEPYSPPGYPIDSVGVAIVPSCCDEVNQGNSYKTGPEGELVHGNNIQETDSTGAVIQQKGNTIRETAVDAGERVDKRKGAAPRLGAGTGTSTGTGIDCAKVALPYISFDDDKFNIDPSYENKLQQIAERMLLCPDIRLVVTGFNESRNDPKFNEQLSWNRANAAVDYLVEKYGISRDRFILKYRGGKKAASSPAERKATNKVDFRYANDGESGSSNPPAPHPGLKAGSSDK
ncbi:MAG: OmpA family protein [Bacteroidetes bacterium]|nr:OmpA family protein [Bacteroidota bacterium]